MNDPRNTGNSVIGAIAYGDVGSVTRNGAGYNPGTGARVSFLDPARDLAYRYPSDSALKQAMATLKYGGSVQVVSEEDHGRQTLQYGTPPEPFDYYLRHADGSLERCDRSGNVNPALEYAKGVEGVNANPDEPTTPTTTKPGDPIPASGSMTLPWKHVKSTEKEHPDFPPATLQPGQSHTYIVAIPADAQNGGGWIKFRNENEPIDLIVTGGTGTNGPRKDEQVGNSDSMPASTFTVGEDSNSGAGRFDPGYVLLATITNVGARATTVYCELIPPGLA